MKKSEAIKLFGSKVNLANALGLTRGAISNWPENVPKLRVYQIKEILSQKKTTNDNSPS